MNDFNNKPIKNIKARLDDYGHYVIIYYISDVRFIRIHQNRKSKVPYLWVGIPVLNAIEDITPFINALEFVKVEMQRILDYPEYIEELYERYKNN